MDKTRDKWNRIYSGDRPPGSPSTVLTDNLDLLPTKGVALDLACGLGADSILLATRGLKVHAWDLSKVAIAKLNEQAESLELDIITREIDITPADLAPGSYDLIVTSHYLDRDLAPAILEATRPGGLICYQTFTAAKQLDLGPSNPEFLLKPFELQSFVPGCEILAFRDESLATNRDELMAGQACIIARKPETSSVNG